MTTTWLAGKDWEEGETDPTGALNTYLRDNQLFLARPPTARVKRTAAPIGGQIPASGVWTEISFQAAERNNDGMFSTTIPDATDGPKQLTIQHDGIYRLGAQLSWPANATGRRGLEIVRLLADGSARRIVHRIVDALPGTAEPSLTVGTIWLAQAGDRFRCRVYQDSGAALAFKGGASFWANWKAGVVDDEAPPWLDPITWVDSGDETDDITAELLTAYLTENDAFLYAPPAVRLRAVTTQLIKGTTDTPILFDSEYFDPWHMHDTASGASRIVAPIAGLYEVGLAWQWNGTLSSGANATGIRAAKLRSYPASGTVIDLAKDVVNSENDDAAPKDIPYNHAIALVRMEPGDYVQAEGSTNFASTLSLGLGLFDDASPVFWALWVGGG